MFIFVAVAPPVADYALDPMAAFVTRKFTDVDAHVGVGRDDLEYSTEEDMRLVSLQTTPVLGSICGYNSHYQLRDNFAISSIGTSFSLQVVTAARETTAR